MAHTAKVIAGGLLLLALCLAAGWWTHRTAPASGIVLGATVFVPVWFAASAVNMWIGVKKAGYSVTEEAPIFLIVFAVPAIFAAAAWWMARR